MGYLQRWRGRNGAESGIDTPPPESGTPFLRSADLRPWPTFVVAATIAAIVCGIVATWDFSTGDPPGVALRPDANIGAGDDGAGDTLSPAAAAERYLPIPATLEDERVIAALAPIADLTCKRSDYEPPPTQDQVSAPLPDLGPVETDAGVYSWIDRYATAAALSPITERPDASAQTEPPSAALLARERALAAPLSAPESDINALLTYNLLGAALSPIAALPAPEAASTPEAVAVAPSSPAVDCPALLRYTFNRLQSGEAQSLCQFQGKVLLIVNTASYCGYTKQYEGLEALYRRYKDRGLVVVGFPSNDFGSQEPGSNKEIAEFCRTTYGVQFPMFEKSSVARLDANPLYIELARKTGAAPKWNFHKYVVDRSGTRITSFASDVTPEARNLMDLVERLLAEQPAAHKG
jgi:glutathione peroxidase